MTDQPSAQAALVEQIRELAAQGQWGEITPITRNVLDESLDGEGCYLKALALFLDGDMAGAAASGAQALEKNPTAREPADLLALVYAMVGEVGDSSYFRKLAMSRSSDPRLAALWPKEMPDFERVFLGVYERPLFHQGLEALAAKRYRDAEFAFTQQMAFTPHERDTLIGLGASLIGQEAWAPALAIFQSLRHLYPDDGFIAGEMAGVLVRQGRLAEGMALYRVASRLLPNSAVLRVNSLLDSLRDPCAAPEALRKTFANFATDVGAAVKTVRFALADEGQPLNVVCLVGASAASRASVAITAMLTYIDPRHFRLIGLGFGELTHPLNSIYQGPFDEWLNVSGVDPHTLRSMIRAQSPQVIIDFAGMEAPEHLPIFASRMAPVQLAWQNQPFDLGLTGYTGIITDRWAETDDAKGDLEPLYMESGAALISLDDQEINQTTEISEVAVGTLAGFADLHPETVATWARILHACPKLVLQVKDHNFTEPSNLQRLIDLFGQHGLSHRVDVVSSVETDEFLGQLDVLLMPVPVLQPSQVVDGLSGGALPVMLSVPHRIGRQPLALLDQLGLSDDCVASSLDDYADKAIRLIGDAARRAELGRMVRDKLADAPVFDAKAKAEQLSALLSSAYQKAVEALEA